VTVVRCFDSFTTAHCGEILFSRRRPSYLIVFISR